MGGELTEREGPASPDGERIKRRRGTTGVLPKDVDWRGDPAAGLPVGAVVLEVDGRAGAVDGRERRPSGEGAALPGVPSGPHGRIDRARRCPSYRTTWYLRSVTPAPSSVRNGLSRSAPRRSSPAAADPSKQHRQHVQLQLLEHASTQILLDRGPAMEHHILIPSRGWLADLPLMVGAVAI